MAAAAVHAAVAPAAAAGEAAEAEQLTGGSVEFDREVAAIFTDEATELIDAAERALADWCTQPESAEYRLGLKRPLHALKGGARMAGIIPMGDLSHELETLVMSIDKGTVGADAAVFDVIQARLDELARMREQVINGRRVSPARAIIARLQSLSRTGGAPNSAAAPTPSAAPARAADAVVPAPAPTPPPQLTDGAADAADSLLVKMNAELLLSRGGGPPAARAVPELALPEAAAEAGPEAPTAAVYLEPEPEFPWRGAAPGALPPAAGEEGPSSPLPVPPGREPVAGAERQEMARVDADLLDQLLNISGEASIARARLEQQLGSFDFNLGELSRTVTRLKEQLRSLEIETEAQILHKHEDEGAHRSEFDPLQLDRYSAIQQYSRALAETANDVASIQQLLESLAKDTQTLLQQQARTITELQNGLMRTRMVPFQRHVQRLARIVRQAAAETGKRAELIVEGASGELDRQPLGRLPPPFEHMLRNAGGPGIENPQERRGRRKPGTP